VANLYRIQNQLSSRDSVQSKTGSDLVIHLQWRGFGQSRCTNFLMDPSYSLPKSSLGMNELYPLDGMAIYKLLPLCINEQEGAGWTGKLMEADVLSVTACQ